MCGFIPASNANIKFSTSPIVLQYCVEGTQHIPLNGDVCKICNTRRLFNKFTYNHWCSCQTHIITFLLDTTFIRKEYFGFFFIKEVRLISSVVGEFCYTHVIIQTFRGQLQEFPDKNLIFLFSYFSKSFKLISKILLNV